MADLAFWCWEYWLGGSATSCHFDANCGKIWCVSDPLLKVVSTIFLLVCFLSLHERTYQIGKIFTWEALFVLEIIKLTLYFQISWSLQMPYAWSKNLFHWTTWEINSLLMKFDHFMLIEITFFICTKRINLLILK